MTLALLGRRLRAAGPSDARDPTGAGDGEPASFELDRLTRHAVCLGMTGSGKTGLCVALLEEAGLAGVPVLAVDPKGDLANLALAFPEHSPSDFAPWVDSEARARELSAQWRQGLAESGVTAERSRAFAERVRVTVHTPGSTRGAPIDVLGGLSAPPAGTAPDDVAELASGAVSGLLALAGVEADPLRDPRHLVLSRILADGWAAGEPMDLERVVVRLVDPPFAKIGVFPVESFLPRDDRMELALALNAIAASPGFAAWSQGAPLDIDALLDTRGGTPIRVMYLAHLDEAQRAFFLALLLDRIVAWSRRQPGTSSLRALLYLDEVYGLLPPHPRNPPTKKPVLTLLKQARAVGLGTVLATQNPVDVDYAALANAGTWFVGRLNTAQDREKALDGLSSAGGGDARALASIVEQLPPRAFLVRDVGAPAPWVLSSRQTLSFLRGPLTLAEVARLAPPTAAPPQPPAPASPPAADVALRADPPPAPPGFDYAYLDPAVVFSARLAPLFSSAALPPRADRAVVWKPALHAQLHLKFDEGREFASERDEHRLWFPLDGASLGDPVEPLFEPGDLLSAPAAGGRFAELPAFVDEARELADLSKRLVEDVLRSETDAMYELPASKLQSRAGETEAAFRARARAAIQDRIDAQVAKLKDKVDSEVKRLEDQRERLVRERDRRASDARARQTQEIVSAGETILGWFFGTRSTATAATRALRNRQSTSAAQARAESADADIAALERKIFDLDAATGDRIREIENAELRALDDVRAVPVRLDRGDVRVERFGIVWVPVTRAL